MDNWRLDSVITHKVASHKCPTSPEQVQHAREQMQILRKTNQMTFEEECDKYNEIMANQTYPDEVEFKEAEYPGLRKLERSDESSMPKYDVGRHVINIDTGHVWKLEDESDVQYLIEKWEDGERNIQIYI